MGSPSSAMAGASLAEPSVVVPGAHRAVAAWLFLCCALVFAIIVVGGVTRLTHSGLSITEWQPIVGALPPLSQEDWASAFAKYRATPEYELVNRGMTLPEFKRIFWWEYAHRLLGRVIGVVFLIPFLWFAARRAIPPGYGVKLALIFVLGALQGTLGWYMVQSGLVDDPQVSQFRLTTHLALAFVIFGAMLWVGQSLLSPNGSRSAPASTRRLAVAVVGLVLLMVISGGFVAGIRAGFAYNTFPLMNGSLLPPELWLLTPWWKNLFYSMATVQFDHRLLALIVALTVLVLWWQVTRSRGATPRAKAGAHLLALMLAVQIALGIATLLLVVPLPLAAAHQAFAVGVFALAVHLAHALR